MSILSIIIPHYNSSDKLLDLLNSIPKLDEIEVIVIDDRSHHLHKNKIEEIKKTNKKVKFFTNTKDNKGAGACRNIGLTHANGKWILFADADDYFLPNFYSTLLEYLNTDYEVIFFKPTSKDLETGNESDRHLNYTKLIEDYKREPAKLSETKLRYSFVVPWSKLVCREFLVRNNIEFDEVIASNDVMFSTKLGHKIKKFAVSDVAIYCVTRNKGSITTIMDYKTFETRVDVFISYYNYLRNEISEEIFKNLDLSGRGFIVYSFKYGPFRTLNTFLKMKNNKVEIFSIRLFNPIWVLKRMFTICKHLKKQKQYQS